MALPGPRRNCAFGTPGFSTLKDRRAAGRDGYGVIEGSLTPICSYDLCVLCVSVVKHLVTTELFQP